MSSLKTSLFAAATVLLAPLSVLHAAATPSFTVDAVAGKKLVFLGDSITQAGGYVTFASYYLNKLYPAKSFDIYGLGLSSETLSGLSEPNHANGAFVRPCLFERLGRLLEKVHPDVVFACYGMNDGIYLPLEPERFGAFKRGVEKLVSQCKAAGVKEIFLVTPPIYDFASKPEEFNYDSVMTAYAEWEMSLNLPGVHVVDLHSAMRKAREGRTEVFSKDRVHPGDEGHLLMAKTMLAAVGVQIPDEPVATIKADPLFAPVNTKQRGRAGNWIKHIGFTREKVMVPQPLGSAEEDAAKLQAEIDAIRRQK
jgi:lysophospholipase L1-like esterase